jgi:lipoprotein-anchoring transpeptidase ErfK/SrfK
MLVSPRRTLSLALASGALLLGACTVSSNDAPDTAAAPAAAAPPAPSVAPSPADSGAMAAPGTGAITQQAGAGAATATSSMRVEVDLEARRLYLYEGDKRIATHGVAVGSGKWPTQTGSWSITQVVWNPEWTPPDESWAEQREPRQPGDPKNPLGRAQLIYDPPRTIHGTNEPASIGKAVSHGSIRVANEVAVQLARQLMEATGAGKDEAWYRKTQANRTVKQIVDLPQKVPIRVY